MYTIIKLRSGKFHGQFRLQDGTEHYQYDTIAEAVKGAIDFAKHCNGSKIKKKDILFLEEQPVTETKLVPWDPGKVK